MTTRVGPRHAPRRRWRRWATSPAGATSTPPPPARRSAARRPTELAGTSACPCAGGGSAVTLVGGLAATRNGRSRPAAQRIDAHSARSTSAGSGPIDETASTGCSRDGSTSTVGVDCRHPAAHAPAVQRHADDRADRYRSQQLLRERVVELLVEPGDVGQDPDAACAADPSVRVIRVLRAGLVRTKHSDCSKHSDRRD